MRGAQGAGGAGVGEHAALDGSELAHTPLCGTRTHPRALYPHPPTPSTARSYLSIVRKTYEDMVPKIVVCLLINRAKDEIQSELVQRLYASLASNVDELLAGACRRG